MSAQRPWCRALCPEQHGPQVGALNCGCQLPTLLFGWVWKAAFSPLLVNQLLRNSWAEQGIPAYTNAVSSPAKNTFQYLCGEHEPHKSPQVPRLGTTDVRRDRQTCSWWNCANGFTHLYKFRIAEGVAFPFFEDQDFSISQAVWICPPGLGVGSYTTALILP